MKSKLILRGKTIELLLEDGSKFSPKRGESQEKFVERMEAVYAEKLDPLTVTMLDKEAVSKAGTDQLKVLAGKYEGTLYAALIEDVLGERNAESTEAAPVEPTQKQDVKSAKAEAKAEAEKRERERQEVLEMKAKKREEIAELKRQGMEAKEALKAEKAEADRVAKEAKNAERAEAAAKAKAVREAEKAEKAEAAAAAKLEKIEADKLAKEAKEAAKAEKLAAKEAAKAEKIAAREAAKAERANKPKVYMSITSEKYSQEILEAAKGNVGKQITVLKKDKTVRFEGTIATVVKDKRNGSIFYRVQDAAKKTYHTTIDSFANVIK